MISRILVLLVLLTGCAHAKPKVMKAVKPKPAVVEVVAPTPVLPEKISESELLRYKAAFMAFKALEAEIIEKYHIRAADGEVFDPDTAVITRVKKSK